MTKDHFERALRAFAGRQPFRHFLIEFVSGDVLLVKHPEAVRFRGDLVVSTSPAGTQRVFESESVCQLMDAGELPTTRP